MTQPKNWDISLSLVASQLFRARSLAVLTGKYCVRQRHTRESQVLNGRFTWGEIRAAHTRALKFEQQSSAEVYEK